MAGDDVAGVLHPAGPLEHRLGEISPAWADRAVSGPRTIAPRGFSPSAPQHDGDDDGRSDHAAGDSLVRLRRRDVGEELVPTPGLADEVRAGVVAPDGEDQEDVLQPRVAPSPASGALEARSAPTIPRRANQPIEPTKMAPKMVPTQAYNSRGAPPSARTPRRLTLWTPPTASRRAALSASSAGAPASRPKAAAKAMPRSGMDGSPAPPRMRKTSRAAKAARTPSPIRGVPGPGASVDAAGRRAGEPAMAGAHRGQAAFPTGRGNRRVRPPLCSCTRRGRTVFRLDDSPRHCPLVRWLHAPETGRSWQERAAAASLPVWRFATAATRAMPHRHFAGRPVRAPVMRRSPFDVRNDGPSRVATAAVASDTARRCRRGHGGADGTVEGTSHADRRA